MNTLQLSLLDTMTSKQIIQSTLSSYGKKLDTRQLDALLSKTDIKIPLYIVVACEELRVFGIHEKLTSCIFA
jgi:hypothetical protein